MPGSNVKNWRKYHSLRRKGYGKRSAARIANKRANVGTRKGRTKATR